MAYRANSIEERAIRELKRSLSDSGIHVRRVRELPPGSAADAELDVRLPNGENRRIVVEVKGNSRRAPIEAALSQLRNYVVHMSPAAQPLLVSSYLGRPMRAWLRSQGVWFADLAGNRFFFGPGLLVDREVADRPESAKERAPSVFADRNSRVLRYLVPRPAIRIGIRELARKIDLSPAAVSVGLKRLREMGYLAADLGEIRLQDRESLFEEWVSFYRPRFRRQVEERFYVHARSAEAVVDLLRSQPLAKKNGYGLSLHAGASLVAPYVQFREVHIDVAPEAKPFALRLLKALSAQQPSGEANLIFLAPFYKNSFLFESRMIKGVRVVSDIQLYLDLSCFPQRGSEQAQVILDTRIRPSWSAR